MSSGILASATLIGPFGFGPTSGAGTHQGSRGSRWLITSSASLTSATWRASGPCADIRCASIGRSAVALALKAGIRPCVGLMVATPLQCAGQRSEPPMSLPCAMVPMPAATAEPAPPEEPPQVILGSQGLSVSPCRGLSVKPRKENSGVLVRPMMIAPAFFRLRTTGESDGAMRSLLAGTPLKFGRPS
ncbi:hypothetical protein ACVWZ6_000564 [Bradyrhizobium sp. GM6.1]